MKSNPDLQNALSLSNIDWQFTGRVMVVDNGGRLPRYPLFYDWMALDAFSTVIFDPLNSLASKEDLKKNNELQIIPNITLGDGQPVLRFDCLYEETSATLEPLAETLAAKNLNKYGSTPNMLLANPPINTVALDKINGLNRLDWLLLDYKNNNLKILQHSENLLQDTLLIDIQVPFRFSHMGQTDFSTLQYKMLELGFSFLGFSHAHHESFLPIDQYLEKKQASRLLEASALFIPSDEKLEKLDKSRLHKLGFLLYTIYSIKDVPYQLLKLVNDEDAENYLYAEGFKIHFDKDETEFTLSYENSPDIWANPYEDYPQEEL